MLQKRQASAKVSSCLRPSWYFSQAVLPNSALQQLVLFARMATVSAGGGRPEPALRGAAGGRLPALARQGVELLAHLDEPAAAGQPLLAHDAASAPCWSRDTARRSPSGRRCAGTSARRPTISASALNGDWPALRAGRRPGGFSPARCIQQSCSRLGPIARRNRGSALGCTILASARPPRPRKFGRSHRKLTGGARCLPLQPASAIHSPPSASIRSAFMTSRSSTVA